METERARELGAQPLARLVAFAVTGCLPEEMGIGPITAIPAALKRAGLILGQIDLIELNEAFAAQALAVIRTLGIDPERVNVNGRGDCAGASAGMHWREIDGFDSGGDGAAPGAVWDGDDVRRRRAGGGGNF